MALDWLPLLPALPSVSRRALIPLGVEIAARPATQPVPGGVGAWGSSGMAVPGWYRSVRQHIYPASFHGLLLPPSPPSVDRWMQPLGTQVKVKTGHDGFLYRIDIGAVGGPLIFPSFNVRKFPIIDGAIRLLDFA